MEKRIKVLWIPTKLILNNKSQTLWGICEQTERIFTVTSNYLVLLIVADIFLGDTCEEAARCLNVRCAFNKATPQTLTKHFGRQIVKSFDKLPIEERLPELPEIFASLCAKYPDGGILIASKLKYKTAQHPTEGVSSVPPYL